MLRETKSTIYTECEICGKSIFPTQRCLQDESTLLYYCCAPTFNERQAEAYLANRSCERLSN